MDSRDLLDQGFSHWRAFCRSDEGELLKDAPPLPGVYVLRRREPYRRRHGMSDLAYIGSAVNSNGLRMRFRQYFHPGPTQSTNQRILALCGESDQFEVAFVVTESRSQAKATETALLEHYEAEHGDLPPENRRR